MSIRLTDRLTETRAFARPIIRLSMGTEKPKADLLPGTLDMMVLKILTRGHLHGYAIAQLIQQLSDEPAVRGRRLSLSRASTAGTEWLDRGGVGSIGQQSPGSLLHAHAGRPEASQRGSCALPAGNRSGGADYGIRLVESDPAMEVVRTPKASGRD